LTESGHRGGGSAKKAASKKIADTEGVSFLRFQNWARGRGVGLYAVFPIAGPFRFCFFDAVLTLKCKGRRCE
jgi:hypothetical protein